jgi:aspartate carbamoyltransferase catalytic subunit
MPELSSPSNASADKSKGFAGVLDGPGWRLWRKRRHLLDVDGITADELSALSAVAARCKEFHIRNCEPLTILARKTVANVFFENSTRTRSSFELAARKLGATIINFDPKMSSVSKGETISDTASILINLGVDAIVQRHSASGSAHQIARELGDRVQVINAGDGWHAHPTQALLDYFTMTEVRPQLGGAKITIVGDIKHSRVARCNIALLTGLGAQLHVVGPPTLLPLELDKLGVTVHTSLAPALEGADFVMCLRLQTERMEQGLIPSIGEYKRLYRVDHQKLQLANKDVRLLHPGPVNRDIEITDDLVNDEKYSLISTLVHNGIAVRMAVLYFLLADEEKP